MTCCVCKRKCLKPCSDTRVRSVEIKFEHLLNPFFNMFNFVPYAEAAGEQSPVFLLHQCFGQTQIDVSLCRIARIDKDLVL